MKILFTCMFATTLATSAFAGGPEKECRIEIPDGQSNVYLIQALQNKGYSPIEANFARDNAEVTHLKITFANDGSMAEIRDRTNNPLATYRKENIYSDDSQKTRMFRMVGGLGDCKKTLSREPK